LIRLSAFSDEAGKELSAQIDALKRNDIHLTELRGVGSKNVSELTASEAKEVYLQLSDNGISLSALGSPIGKVKISVDFPRYLDKVKHMCELSNILGTEKIRIFSFFEAYNERSRVMEYLCRMVETAAEYNIILCHENEKKIYGDTAERVLDIAENVSGMRFIYDPANFLQVGEAAEKTLPSLHKMSDYFHIKDMISETGELVPAGHGDGRISELVKMIDRDTVLTIEPHLKIFGGYDKFDGEKLVNKYSYRDNNEAFDAAVSAIKKILAENGYVSRNGGFERA